jgi:hypothetical protein
MKARTFKPEHQLVSAHKDLTADRDARGGLPSEPALTALRGELFEADIDLRRTE